jgi:hypothetical protein
LEFLVAKYFDYRKNLIIPNVSWGWTTHECDLLVVSPSGRVLEVELKISKSDLLNDLKKPHHHKAKNIHEVWFAVPEELLEAAKEVLDSKFGIAYIHKCSNGKYVVEKARKAKTNTKVKAATEKDVEKLKRLLCMRIWGMKKKIADFEEKRRAD